MVTTGSEANRPLAHAAVRAVLTGDVATAELLYSPHVRMHDCLPAARHGHAAVRERAMIFAGALWNSAVCVHSCVCTDGVVTLRWSARGTHNGELLGTKPTRRSAVIEGLTVLRIEQGRVVEQRNDQLSIAPSRHGEPQVISLA